MKTTILGLAPLVKASYQMILGHHGGIVFIGLRRADTLYVLPIAASELAAVEQPGQLMALTVTHLLQQHAQHPGGNDKHDRIGVCFVEETFTDGVLSAEVELDARTLYRAMRTSGTGWRSSVLSYSV